jgi:hypothetical protein
MAEILHDVSGIYYMEINASEISELSQPELRSGV